MASVDINTAPPHQMILLRGIGPVGAARIIAARPFSSTHELVTRLVISETTFDRIASKVTVGTGQANPRAAHVEAVVLWLVISSTTRGRLAANR
jgi:hypothetical protein